MAPCDDEPAAHEFLRRADHEVDRLIQLVEELLELSRIESGELPLALQRHERRRAAARRPRSACGPRPNAPRSTSSLELDADLGTAQLDATHIERAVLNLVQNAIKFTPPGGSVSAVGASRRTAPW